MAVNENVYGTSDQWLNCYFQPKTITENERNKKANFGSNNATLGQGVSSGKLSYSEPIDKSLSYCGLGAESALSHIAYLKNGSNDIDSYQDRFVTNFAFFERTSNSYVLPPSSYKLSRLNEYAWQASQASYANLSPTLEPYTKVNPKNIVLVIYVVAYNTAYTAEVRKPLKEYLTSYTTSHPYISSVYVTPYFGRVNSSADARTVYTQADNRIPFIIGLLDEYEFTSENTNFYMYSSTNLSIFGQFHDNYEIPSSCYGIIAHTENSKPHFKISQSGSITRFAIEYYPEFESDILKTAACFGLYFTTVAEVARTGLLTNPDMYIGILDENGIGHGEYLRGADTVNAPQNEFTDMSQSGYDYTKEVDKTKYKNDTEFYDSTLANGFTRFWVLDSNGVSQVLNEMYNIMNDVDPDEPIERYSQKVFLTNNPIDCIISLKKFPVLHIPSLSGAYFVNFGSKATSISAYPLSKSCETYTFNFSAANDTSLYPVFGGDYRDFEPYTKCEVIIPFCGSVDVPCCYFYEYGGITVKLTIDFISGACTGFVLANGITINSVSGNCAIDMPVSGIQSATLDSQIFSAAQAKKQNFTKTRAGLVASALTATAGAITGNPLLLVAGAAGVLTTAISSKETVKNIDYELQHLQTPYKEVSTASGQIAQSFDMRCKLIITRPKMLNFDENAYAETVGYACLNSGSVDSFHGLTYGAIELNGVPCTADEKSYIESVFANGVHLPTTYP